MHTQEHAVRLNAGGIHIDADVSVPANAAGVVLFVQGSGTSRHSPRNRFIAAHLRAQGLGTVLMDLLTRAEERADQFSGHLRWDISFLARRVMAVLDQVRGEGSLPLGLFGASTGAAAALVVASSRPALISAVVLRGGRPDLAGQALASVKAPTLLLVGAEDRDVIESNRRAAEQMTADTRLEIVPGASHLFHEPGALETVGHLAAEWFTAHLVAGRR